MSRPRKRTAGMLLTGGTGDVNPQLFKISSFSFENLQGSGATGTVQAVRTVQLPIQSFQQPSNGRAVVMEILKVFFTPTPNATLVVPGKCIYIWRLGLVTGTVNVANAEALLLDGMSGQGTIAWAEGAIIRSSDITDGHDHLQAFNQQTIDLTDGQGHGVLVASPTMSIALNLFVNNNAGANSGFASDSVFSASFLYRFKEVSLSEFIGIQQSQSANV